MANFLKRALTQDKFVTENIDIFQNTLLGNYNEKGVYFLNEKIVKELFALPKLKKSNFYNSVFCVSNKAGLGELIFEIEFDNKSKAGKAISSLYLLETVYKIDGYLENTLKTKLADFESDLEDYLDKTYKYFNVKLTGDEIEKKKITEDEALESFMFLKHHFDKMIYDASKEEYNNLYKKYLDKRMQILNLLDSPYTRLILKEYNREYSLISKSFNIASDYKMQSELLDKVLEAGDGDPKLLYYEKEYKNSIKQIVSDLVLVAKNIEKKSTNIALNSLEKAEKTKINKLMPKADEINNIEASPIISNVENDNETKKQEDIVLDKKIDEIINTNAEVKPNFEKNESKNLGIMQTAKSAENKQNSQVLLSQLRSIKLSKNKRQEDIKEK